jgi:23S rRNA pseudouridine1911/1915/1917 synthase
VKNVETVRVLASSSGVVAVAKPAGVATQAPAGFPSVEAWARGAITIPPGHGYLGLPHRLDRAVSGVLLLAITPRAARKLSRQFERREVRKTYLALVALPPGGLAAVETILPGGSGDWRDQVAKLPDEPRAVTVSAGSGGRDAVTLVRSLRTRDVAGELRLLLELRPLTGRMHQLRLQSAARGMPIVGDALYGGPPLADGNLEAGDPRLAPILLHAWKIAYTDPDSAASVEVTAEPPPYWPEVI